MKMKPQLVVAAAGVLGSWLADELLIKHHDGDKGFVMARPGIGFDDVALGASVALVYGLISKVVGR